MPEADWSQAVVDPGKITDYLLSKAHPRGRSKAVFFRSLGFDRHNWKVLADEFLTHSHDDEKEAIESTAYGTLYQIESQLLGPNGHKALIRSIWLLRKEEVSPRFVTAYPLRRRTK